MNTVEEILYKAKRLSKAVTLAQARTKTVWIESYAEVAVRLERRRKFGINGYPY